MADTKITDLAALDVTPASGDLFVIVDVSDTSMAASGTNKKITWLNLIGNLIRGTLSSGGVVPRTTAANTVGDSAMTIDADGTVVVDGAGTHILAGDKLSVANDVASATKSVTLDVMGSNPKASFYGSLGEHAHIEADGIDFLTLATSQSMMFINPDGTGLEIYDDAATKWVTISHNGTNATITPSSGNLILHGSVTVTSAGVITGASISSGQVTGLGTVAALASDTDGTLAANSDIRVATQKATKTYVDNAVTGLLEFKGSTDCSANPNYPAASKGDAYVVSVAGKIGGASGKSVDVGDVYVASADNAGGTEASVGTSWFVLEHNLQGALLAANNLSDVASISTALQNLGSGTAATGTGGVVLATSPTITTPFIATIKAAADASGTNAAGTNEVIKPGASTGNATPSKVCLQSSVAGSSGTTVQTLYDTLVVTAGESRGYDSGGTLYVAIGDDGTRPYIKGSHGNLRLINAGTATGYIEFVDAAGNVRARVNMVSASFDAAAGLQMTGSRAITGTGGAAMVDMVRADGIAWRASSFGSYETGVISSAAGIVTLTNGSTGGAALELREQTAPSSPASDACRIYSEDNGAGKTRIMAKFSDGSTAQIAIQP